MSNGTMRTNGRGVWPVPVLSRRTVNPVMAARGLRSAAELAEGKPCGTRLCYYAGCRCRACRTANALYTRGRAAARRRGEGNGLVSAERARLHLAWLSAQGIGRKTAADSAKISGSTVSKVIDGERLKIRAQTERRILVVTEVARADGARIDAAPMWRQIDELIANGYSQVRIASEVAGRSVRGLQLGRERTTVRSADRVRQVWQRLRHAHADAQRRARAQIAELREEHYRPDRILREMAALAALRGWPEPCLQEPLRQQEAELLEAVHARLLMLDGRHDA